MTIPTVQRDPAAEVLRLFEAKAPDWPAKYAPDGPLAHRLVALTVAVRWRARAGSRVLDLGCGTGELARALTASGLEVTGCDISPQMLRQARDEGGCAGWVRLSPDWRRLPFASGAFDVVVATSVLEYVTEPGAVLSECARVLRPGGLMLYTVPDLRHPVRWAEWCAQSLARLTETRVEALPGGSRAGAYGAYLRTSRQRHRVRWWLAVSGSAGLHPVPCPGPDRSALRLLAFRRPEETVARAGER